MSYRKPLGLPAFSLKELMVRGARPRLFHCLVLVLLESDGPVTIEEIVVRVARAGVDGSIEELRRSIGCAWHGSAPVLRSTDGRFALNIRSRRVLEIARAAGLLGGAPKRPDSESITGWQWPLTLHEIECLHVEPLPPGLTGHALALAVLDAACQPTHSAEVLRRLNQQCGFLGQFPMLREASWYSMASIVRERSDGLALTRGSPVVHALRTGIRLMREGSVSCKEEGAGLLRDVDRLVSGTFYETSVECPLCGALELKALGNRMVRCQRCRRWFDAVASMVKRRHWYTGYRYVLTELDV